MKAISEPILQAARKSGFVPAIWAAALICPGSAGTAHAQTSSPANWPAFFNGTTEMGPYAWANGPAYYKKDPSLSAAVLAGQDGQTKLYICRFSWKDGIHPGKFFNGQCNIGWGGREVAVGHNYEILVNTRPDLASFLTQNWVKRTSSGLDRLFIGGRVGNTDMVVCRAWNGGKTTPGKEWNGKCLIGYGGKEVADDNYQVLFLHFDHAKWLEQQAKTRVHSVPFEQRPIPTPELQPSPPSGPPMLVLLKSKSGACLKADGSNNLPLGRCHTIGTEWVYHNGLLRPHSFPQLCLMHVYDRTTGRSQMRATTTCKNVDTPQMHGNVIFFLEKDTSDWARIRLYYKPFPDKSPREVCLYSTGDQRGYRVDSKQCSERDLYQWALPIVSPPPKYEAMPFISFVDHEVYGCLGAQGVDRNVNARSGTDLGLINWGECAKEHPLKNYIKEMNADNKTFRLRFAGTNLCMDIKDGVAYRPGSNVHLWECHNLASQKWYQVGNQIRSGVGRSTQHTPSTPFLILNPDTSATSEALCLQRDGRNVRVNVCRNDSSFNFSLSTTHQATYIEVR